MKKKELTRDQIMEICVKRLAVIRATDGSSSDETDELNQTQKEYGIEFTDDEIGTIFVEVARKISKKKRRGSFRLLIRNDGTYEHVYMCFGQDYEIDENACDSRQKRGWSKCRTCSVRKGGIDDPR